MTVSPLQALLLCVGHIVWKKVTVTGKPLPLGEDKATVGDHRPPAAFAPGVAARLACRRLLLAMLTAQGLSFPFCK